MMEAIKFKVVSKWDNNKIYQATNGKLTIPFTVESVKDGIGTLSRVECSKTGYFEEYGMDKVKQRITKLFL